jgi:DNA invertase Pin-like site-specific DNA recombinase
VVVRREVPRLARNNRDCYQLLDLCVRSDTLIIDGECVFNLRQPNNRPLVGLKGTRSEVGLGWIRPARPRGLLAKAQRGGAPARRTGRLRQTHDRRLEKHPDSRIQEAIALVFEKFADWAASATRSCGFATSVWRCPPRVRS